MTDATIIDQTEALVRAAWSDLAQTRAYKAMMETVQYKSWQALNSALRTMKQSADKVTPAEEFAPPPGKAKAIFPRLSQAGVARRALVKAGRPMSTSELITRLEEMGYPVGGENPELNLSSTLSRSETIVSVKHEGISKWWIKSQKSES